MKFNSDICIKMDEIERMISEVNEVCVSGKMSEEEEVKYENWRLMVKDML